MILETKEHYVQQILAFYRATPGTRGRVRTADRRLAEKLYEEAISARLVREALLLAAARRAARSPDAEPLQPIVSLHYFLPVLRELRAEPIDPEYVEYVEYRLVQLTGLPRLPELNTIHDIHEQRETGETH
jgi:hypothetical protein